MRATMTVADGQDFSAHYGTRRGGARRTPRNTRRLGPGGAASSRAQTLERLFQEPRELAFPGSFVEARRVAQARGSYLMVNIQVKTEFMCHQLNRDTWSDPTVQAVIESGFVFALVRWLDAAWCAVLPVPMRRQCAQLRASGRVGSHLRRRPVVCFGRSVL